MDKIKNIEPVNPSQWGVHGGCITVQNPQNFISLDDQLAIVICVEKSNWCLNYEIECQGIAKKALATKGLRSAANFAHDLIA